MAPFSKILSSQAAKKSKSRAGTRGRPEIGPSEGDGRVSDLRVDFLAESSTVEGTWSLRGVGRLEGKVVGTVRGEEESRLLVAENGSVEGEIHCPEVHVEGHVRGTIRARERIVIASSGRVTGILESPRIRIESGAFFEGECRSGSEAPAQTPSTG